MKRFLSLLATFTGLAVFVGVIVILGDENEQSRNYRAKVAACELAGGRWIEQRYCVRADLFVDYETFRE